jgi:hypothetical protein
MKIRKFPLLMLVSGFAFAGSMSAQATRTWVSGVGDDANPCSRTAPCKTFAGALSKTAAGGEIDALDPGGFGAVTITKALTIDGGGQVASVLTAGTPAITVSAGASDVVVLRNLGMNGIGGLGTVGLSVLSAGQVSVEHCHIFGFLNDGITFGPSGTASLHVVDTIVENNGGNGVAISGGGAATYAAMDKSQFVHNGAAGIYVGSGGVATVANSTSSQNTGAGLSVTAGTLNLVNSNVTLNGGAGVLSNNSTASLGGSSISLNASALSAVSGGSIVSYGNNTIAGSGNPTSTVALK